eukprot:222185_1
MESEKWCELSSFISTSIGESIGPDIFGINKENYFVINQSIIHKYDIINDQWQQIIKMPYDNWNGNFFCSNYGMNSNQGCASLNVDKQILYIHQNGNLFEIHLNDKRINIINTHTDVGDGSKSTMINDQFIVIGGNNSKYYFQWNSQKNKFKVESTLSHPICHSGLVLVDNYLLFFGGSQYTDPVNNIIQYDIIKKNWNKLEITLPKSISKCACIKTIDNKYVLIFGGLYLNSYCNDIYIYSILSKTISLSKLKCPVNGIFFACTVKNDEKDKNIVFGFVRKAWRECNIIQHYFPPQYLLNLMKCFYSTEHVYLLEKYSDNYVFCNHHHWEIDIIHVFNS